MEPLVGAHRAEDDLRCEQRPQPEGCLLVAIDGESTHTFGDLQCLLADRSCGASLELSIVRSGQPISLPLILGGTEACSLLDQILQE